MSKLDLLRRVARRIREVRMARGLTQEALAGRLGIALKNAQRLEGGRQNVTLRTLDAVASALRVDAWDLMQLEGTSLPSRKEHRSDLARLAEGGATLVPAEDAPPEGAVPVLSLEAAASRAHGATQGAVTCWAVLPRRRTPAPDGSFVARIRGRSMAPLVPDGACVLFGVPRPGPLDGRLLLLAHRDPTDPENAAACMLKRLDGFERMADGALGVRLRALDASFAPFTLPLRDATDLAPVGEFLRVVAR